MPRIAVTNETAGEIARLRYLLRPGRILSQAEAMTIILEEWRTAKKAELAELAELAKRP